MPQICTKYSGREQISPNVSLLKTFVSNWPIICNHHQTIISIKERETFCERLKWLCKLFKTDGQNDFKNLSLSQNPVNILFKNWHKEGNIKGKEISAVWLEETSKPVMPSTISFFTFPY